MSYEVDIGPIRPEPCAETGNLADAECSDVRGASDRKGKNCDDSDRARLPREAGKDGQHEGEPHEAGHAPGQGSHVENHIHDCEEVARSGHRELKSQKPPRGQTRDEADRNDGRKRFWTPGYSQTLLQDQKDWNGRERQDDFRHGEIHQGDKAEKHDRADPSPTAAPPRTPGQEGRCWNLEHVDHPYRTVRLSLNEKTVRETGRSGGGAQACDCGERGGQEKPSPRRALMTHDEGGSTHEPQRRDGPRPIRNCPSAEQCIRGALANDGQPLGIHRPEQCPSEGEICEADEAYREPNSKTSDSDATRKALHPHDDHQQHHDAESHYRMGQRRDGAQDECRHIAPPKDRAQPEQRECARDDARREKILLDM